ncbi:sensor histidine kinase [Clostridium hydrogenum]|uniref:sensor histidine kinase n=1 Tax=Clostridium hydrogenum TaxID=2855764 RepID=UPI001F32B041|nr:HAMP domain-containing sensor histidine kinase [Clostridium hydrogenum]
MKLWEKIFLCTLIVFEVFFVSSSMYLIHRSFERNLQNEINIGMIEENKFCDSIKLSIKFFEDKKNPPSDDLKVDKKSIDSMVCAYASYFNDRNVYLYISDKNNKTIFTNFKEKIISNKSIWNISFNSYSYFIHDINKHTYLFVNKKINLNKNIYKITYVKEISQAYEDGKYLYNVLIKANIAICLILAVVMILLSKIIIRPIDELVKSTKKISSGDFSERVKIKSHDEISNLSINFNCMAQVIEDKINELERISEDKQRFIDDLSHELKTPLTSIIGYADFLRTTDKYDEETHIKCLTYIYKEGKRLQKLSLKLRDLIVLREEKPIMKMERVQELLREVQALITPKLKSKNIKLIIKAQDLCINMDRELIIILITNLVDNAIKASQDDGEIYIRAYVKESPVIEIADNGIGIPKEDINKIFEPFYMVDKSRDRSNNGSGLGLSICAQISKIHNAKLEVESEVNKGTRIAIRFLNEN